MKTLISLAATLSLATAIQALENPLPASSQKTVPFYVQMRDGSVIKVQANDEEFQWKTVARDGSISATTFKVADIKSLKFAVSPASDEVARIRGLVSDLASDDYHRRHEAEKTLVTEGKPFEAVIEQARDHNEPEVRYRVTRILTTLANIEENQTTRYALDFDILQLQDGRKLEGDVADLMLQCNWNDVAVVAKRSNCQRVLSEADATSAIQPDEAATAAVEVRSESVVTPDLFFSEDAVKEGFTWANFDTTDGGKPTVGNTEFAISELFSYLGGKLFCETHNGRVVLTSFKFKQGRSRGRSIGNLYIDPESQKMVKYKGAMRIDFCTPGNGSIPATVNQIGMFVEIVKARQTMIEAYNSAGHIIGVTQAANPKSSFIGVDSSAEIAYVRVIANEYLDLERYAINKLNTDFAVDDLCFSAPTLASEINFVDGDEKFFVVVTTSDERLLAQSVNFDQENSKINIVSATEGISDFSLAMADVRWVVGAQSRDTTPPSEEGVYAMLGDGSVVHCQLLQNQIAATANQSLTLTTDDIIGVWGSSQVARYPHPDDFSHGKIVMVHPLNRIAFENADFDWAEGKLRFDTAGAVDIQQSADLEKPTIVTGDVESYSFGLSGEEPMPDSIDFANSSGVWTAPPQTRAGGTGLLRTSDGQQFVLGGSDGFELAGIDGETVTVKRGDQEIEFDISQIYALQLSQ